MEKINSIPFKDHEGLVIEGPLIIKTKIFEDSRGFFYESWNNKDFNETINLDISFVQDNHAKSFKNVMRGLHYQLPPHSQSKLIRCVSGEIFDVIVDIRKKSPTFKKWGSVILSDSNNQQLWIPEGFAHGYFTLSNSAQIIYKTNSFWSPKFERSINWKDPSLSINWPKGDQVIISEKDSNAPQLEEINVNDFF